ncbi:MAG: heme-binding protein [Proteobacteria bacterium]|nr:heme-binding protein [Pseudomonadota bacterium]
MQLVTLEQANTIADVTIKTAEDNGWAPLTVAVYDSMGCLRLVKQPDGCPPVRSQIAMGKAWGAYFWQQPSRTMAGRLPQVAPLFNSLVAMTDGQMVPVIGGVLIKDADGNVLGTAGCSGDQSAKDEAALIAGIKAAGLVSDPAEPDLG